MNLIVVKFDKLYTKLYMVATLLMTNIRLSTDLYS